MEFEEYYSCILRVGDPFSGGGICFKEIASELCSLAWPQK